MDTERHGYYDEEFAYLKTFKNKKIVCLYWYFGRLRGYRGILEDVDAYDSITIEGKKIKFLGEMTAIKYIIYNDRIIIYSNHNVDNYAGHISHFYNLVDLQEKLLCYSVLDENIKDICKKIKIKK